MKIVILSRGPKLYSTRRLRESIQARGHEVEVIDPLRCYMNIADSRPDVHFAERVLNDVDAVLPRIGQSITFYGTAVVRQFEMMGVFTANSSIAISRSRDKLRALQRLTNKGIGMPATGFAHSTRRIKDLIDMVGGPPLIIKTLEGTQGKGVVLCETRKAAESVIDALRNLKANFLVQEFIKEANCSDIRVLVVNGVAVAAMMRQGQEGEFRSNLHKGGLASPVILTEEERLMAVAAAEALSIAVGGVDMIRSNTGPKIIEVNSSPGLRGIEQTSGVDVASHVIDYIEKAVPDKDHDGQMGQVRQLIL